MIVNIMKTLRPLILFIMVAIPTGSRAIIIGEFNYEILSEEDKTVEISLANKFSSSTQIYDLVLPSSIEIGGEEYTVAGISQRGFRNVFRILNSIEVPSSVKVIGSEAFYGLKYVNEVILNDGLDSIGEKAFYLSSIKRIEIPSSVKVISYQAFAELKNVEEVIIHEGLETIGEEVFYNSSLPNSIEIPSSVKIIGDEAFRGIKNVDEVILHEGLDSIGKSTFEDASIKRVNIPSTAVNLGDDIFWFSDLQDIDWPENIHTIPCGCFTGSEITRFDFTNIKNIGLVAFARCRSLENITIPYGCNLGVEAFAESGVKKIAFDGCPGDIHDSDYDYTLINKECFMDCWNLKRIELPCGLKITGPRAFMGCDAVETIVIHEDVDFSYGEIFVGHTEYGEEPYKNWIPDSIIYLADNPMVQPDIFQDVMYEKSPLYVKPKALEKVRNTYPWSKFRNIEVLSSGIDDIPADTDDGQNGPDLFYNLEGVPCGSDRNALAPGIYILRKNGKTSKIVI